MSRGKLCNTLRISTINKEKLTDSLSSSYYSFSQVPSEDSTVVSSYAMHFISGLQGKGGPDPTHLLAASTAKHFISYDLEGYIPRTDPLPRPTTGTCDTSGGCQRWNFDASPRPEDLSGYYAPPFQAAVSVGVRSIMCAYNAVYGQPACASDLLQSILRSNSSSTSWDGHVVSDATAIELMGDSKWDDCKPPYPPLSCTPEPFNSHNYTHTVGETALAALNAGVDVNLGPFFHQWLEALVKNGTVPLSALETSVTRIYTTAIKLGLLDPKAGQIYPNLPPSTVDSLEHRQLALLAAQESIVLLSNPQSLLPLKDTLKFAFIGPHANSTQAFLSNYHGDNHLVNCHSPLQVAQSRGLDVTYSLGCNICDVIPPGFPNMPCTKATDTSGIAAAALVAAAADVAILFLGADQTSEAENFDRNDIGLLGVQEQLAQAVIAAQPKTIVVLISGGIICSPWIVENAPALLYSFYPGELGGDALVDVITGVYNPGGKLPVTMYYPNITTTRDIRDMDLSSGEGITHSYYKGPVLYPFGSGISYTTWEYKLMTMDMKTKVNTMMTKEESEQVLIVTSEDLSRQSLLSSSSTVRVRNTGSRKGDCVLFAFIERQDEVEEKGPFKSLFGFQRLQNIQPGEDRDVEFFIQDAMRAGSALARFNSELRTWEPRKGSYRIHIGDISQDAVIRYLRVV
jgi:beta-D-xylosidase 4